MTYHRTTSSIIRSVNHVHGNRLFIWLRGLYPMAVSVPKARGLLVVKAKATASVEQHDCSAAAFQLQPDPKLSADNRPENRRNIISGARSSSLVLFMCSSEALAF
jgi:hypothetical protein